MDLPGLPFLCGDLRAKVESSRPRMYRVAFAWTHDRALADDLVQEALARALERIRQLRDPQRLEPWLFRILTNCWRDAIRGRVDTEDVEDMDGEIACTAPGPEQAHDSSQTAARVRAAVALLPVGQRQVVTLVDLGEFSYGDAAEILQVPVGTVMSRLSRARAALRESLAADAPAKVVDLAARRRSMR